MEKPIKVRQFKKIELAPAKPAAGGCTPGADPDAPPC